MVYYGNNVFNEKSYKVAVRRAKKQHQNIKNEKNSSVIENENSILDQNINNDGFDQRLLINIPKAYRFFKQRKLEEYENSNKIYSKSELEKHIQRAWKTSPENPLNHISIKENMNSTSKSSLKKITYVNKKSQKKGNKHNNFKLDNDY
ncbi:hypothetical protein BCR32DRAFT_289510 [Anaeromyces robustus]|uniref:Coiled-coil domain-containing protein n=1 Tax=Anaeromyces robustus TaxID=1754192 RepID=A0A1Y1XMZ3_9FUNG|nr:hypothetical protein BCR32DRAFT_289510 [Anaeromyces robustus]|eukprot:ORX87108.1 hypothetical protein BCR32DRAFT_289510 [Anaeromyces robustus]